MKYVLDIQYNGNKNAIVACIGFKNWEDEKQLILKEVDSLARGKEQT